MAADTDGVLILYNLPRADDEARDSAFSESDAGVLEEPPVVFNRLEILEHLDANASAARYLQHRRRIGHVHHSRRNLQIRRCKRSRYH